MKRSFLYILFITVIIPGLQAQPGWEINPNDYQYSVTFTAVVNVNGLESANADDRVAAFSSGQLRGTANCQYVESLDRYFAFLTIYSNDIQGDTIVFKIYDASEDMIYDCDIIYEFTADQNLGDALLPVVFSFPPLNNEAEILSFSLPGETGPAEISPDDHTVHLTVGDEVELGQLTAVFTLSEGAGARVGNVIQESGVSLQNFSGPVVYEVVAENGFVRQTWTVSVSGGIATGIDKSSIEEEMKLYPNPTSGSVFVDIEAGVGEEIEYFMLSSGGKTIKQGKLFPGTRRQIGLGNLSPGIYFIRFQGRRGPVMRRLVVK